MAVNSKGTNFCIWWTNRAFFLAGHTDAIGCWSLAIVGSGNQAVLSFVPRKSDPNRW